MYYAIFDSQGNRLTTYVEGLHESIPAEAIPITEEEQALYITGEYIRDMETGLPVHRPLTPSIEAIKSAKLVELDRAAAAAYVAGFYSTASGQRLYYDSDQDTQKLIDGVYSRTKEADWETKVRYPGVAPAGKAPIRARVQAEDPKSSKTVQLLDAEQLKVLVEDLDAHLFKVKSTLWQKQAEVETAYQAGNIDGFKK